MAHGRERTEKNCLNCNAIVQGRYCQVCGQENVEPRESVWGLITHFFYDITHFDSKFFGTVKYLFLRPGFLSGEYARGRRASYLNPVRMYVFTSAFFFIFFFSMFNAEKINFGQENNGKGWNSESIALYRDEAFKNAKTGEDSQEITKGFGMLEHFSPVEKKETMEDSARERSIRGNLSWDTTVEKYSSVAEYDSVQHALPPKERDGWFRGILYRKAIDIRHKYRGGGAELSKKIFEKFLHTFPYLLFVSLPLYALFLQLLYIGKKMYLTQHGIFLIHLYIFTFLLLLILFGLSAMNDALGWAWLVWLQVILMSYGIWYTYRAMRNFYEQGRRKTIIKFILLNIMAISTLLILFAVFLGLSIFQL